MPRTQDMTHGGPTGLIVRFSLPIIAGNLLQQFYSLVDSIVVGRVDGVAALAAVSASGWLDWAVLSIAMGLCQGFAIEIAQCFGAGDVPALRRAAGQSILLSVLTVLLLGSAAQAGLTPVLRLLRTPEDTFALTELYLRIIFAGLPLVMGVNLLSGFLRSVGDSRTPLSSMICATAANIALDLLFVAHLRWGVAGVAAATVTAQGAAFAICLLAVIRLPVMHPARQDLRPDPPRLRRLLSLGMPIAAQNLVISLGGLVLQRVVNGFGFIFMAGYNAASRLQGLIEIAGASLGSAVGTFAGQNYGARRMDRVRAGLRRSVLIAVLLGLLVGGLMVLFGRQLLGLFVRDEQSMVEEVLRYGYRFLVVMSAGLVPLYLLFVYRSTLQGLGDTVIPMLSGVAELLMRVSSVLLLPFLLGEWGVYLAEIMAWIGAAALLMIGFYARVRRGAFGEGRT